MGDFLATCKQKRLAAIDLIGGVRAGDFVKKYWYDTWYKVQRVWEKSEGLNDACCLWSHRSGNCGKIETDYTFMDDIWLLHRADDPWDLNEVRYVADENGHFGSKNEPPVPSIYEYAGPVRIKSWGYVIRKYVHCVKKDGSQVGTFRNPARNAQFAALNVREFAEIAKVPYEGIKLDEARRIAEVLKGIRNPDGWRMCPTFEAMETYDKSINLKTLEVW